jgi:hypothetical protein
MRTRPAAKLATNVAAIVCLLLAALTLGGCSKCGWFWDDGGHACHSETVH